MIYTEVTPNPSTLKFVTQKILVPKGSADFTSIDETKDSPLAKKLFEFSFVKGVFLSGNFITLTKEESARWEEVIPPVKEVIKSFLENGLPVIHLREDQLILPNETVDDQDEDPIVRRIKQILEENVRPAVAMDGGDVVFESFEEGKVLLKLQGACSGCPSSTMTLKMGIEGLLKRMIPEVETVEAVNG